MKTKKPRSGRRERKRLKKGHKARRKKSLTLRMLRVKNQIPKLQQQKHHLLRVVKQWPRPYLKALLCK